MYRIFGTHRSRIVVLNGTYAWQTRLDFPGKNAARLFDNFEKGLPEIVFRVFFVKEIQKDFLKRHHLASSPRTKDHGDQRDDNQIGHFRALHSMTQLECHIESFFIPIQLG